MDVELHLFELHIEEELRDSLLGKELRAVPGVGDLVGVEHGGRTDFEHAIEMNLDGVEGEAIAAVVAAETVHLGNGLLGLLRNNDVVAALVTKRQFSTRLQLREIGIDLVVKEQVSGIHQGRDAVRRQSIDGLLHQCVQHDGLFKEEFASRRHEREFSDEAGRLAIGVAFKLR